jgi:hypothetical protein
MPSKNRASSAGVRWVPGGVPYSFQYRIAVAIFSPVTSSEEQAVLARLPHDVGEHLLDAVTQFAVDGVVVRALQPVIPDSRRVGHGRVDPGGVRFARGWRNVSHGSPSGVEERAGIRCPGSSR